MRVELPFVLLSATGRPVSGAVCHVYVRGSTSDATVYADSTSGGTLANPLTSDVAGRVEGWLERGSYDCVISALPDLADYTESFDAAPGGDGSVTGAWLADAAVTTPKLANAAVTTAKLADGAVTMAKLDPSASLDTSALPLLAPATDTRNLYTGPGTRVLTAARTTGDTGNRFQLDASGRLSWGDGAAALDTNLYRRTASTLHTDGILEIGSALIIDAQGGGPNNKLYFGNALDTSLYRNGPNYLRTDGAFMAAGLILAGASIFLGYATAGDTLLQRKAGNVVGTVGSFAAEGALTGWGFLAYATGEAQPRAYLRNDGYLWFGPGGNSGPDTSLYRAGVGVLETTSIFQIRTAASTTFTFHVLVPGDGFPRFSIRGDGLLYWGSGNAGQDVYLYRNTALGLYTNGSLNIAGNLLVSGSIFGAPGAELAYTEFQAPVTLSTNIEASANTIVTAPAVTTDGVKAIVVEFFSPQISVPQNEIAVLWLFQDGVSIGMLGYNYSTTTAGNWDTRPNLLARRLIPSAGSHVYSVRGSRNSANATVGAGPGGAGQLMPGFIRITGV